ncbi:hypothetical protein ACOME3_008905 [Neoechinorhynchus agilis]
MCVLKDNPLGGRKRRHEKLGADSPKSVTSRLITIEELDIIKGNKHSRIDNEHLREEIRAMTAKASTRIVKERKANEVANQRIIDDFGDSQVEAQFGVHPGQLFLQEITQSSPGFLNEGTRILGANASPKGEEINISAFSKNGAKESLELMNLSVNLSHTRKSKALLDLLNVSIADSNRNEGDVFDDINTTSILNQNGQTIVRNIDKQRRIKMKRQKLPKGKYLAVDEYTTLDPSQLRQLLCKDVFPGQQQSGLSIAPYTREFLTMERIANGDIECQDISEMRSAKLIQRLTELQSFARGVSENLEESTETGNKRPFAQINEMTKATGKTTNATFAEQLMVSNFGSCCKVLKTGKRETLFGHLQKAYALSADNELDVGSLAVQIPCGKSVRSRVAHTFSLMLEMSKLSIVDISQKEPFGSITVRLNA